MAQLGYVTQTGGSTPHRRVRHHVTFQLRAACDWRHGASCRKNPTARVYASLRYACN